MKQNKNLVKNSLKKFINRIGYDLKKYRKENYTWLINSNIKTVIDIGANTGQFANYIDTILPKVLIYSFEPIKECYEELITNTKDLNVKSFNYALGNIDYTATINVSSHSPSSSLLEMTELHKDLYQFSKTHRQQDINVKKLDDVLSVSVLKKNYMIKLDVQGFEDRVIEGGRDVFSNASIVLIEMSYLTLFKDQLLFDDIYLMLKKLGFSFAGNLNQTVDPNTGRIVYSDSIFINEKSNFN